MLSTESDFFTFKEKLQEGEHGEAVMDEYFKRWFHIEKVSVSNQLRFHYDRDFILKSDSRVKFKIEYKTDLIALRTGNFFVETDVSHLMDNNLWFRDTKGWLYKTQCDWVAVLIGSVIYLVDINVLRYKIFINSSKYKIKDSKPTKTFNKYYHTTGFLMPIKDLERISNIYNIVS